MTEENELGDAIAKLTGTIKEVADRKDAKKASGETAGAETDGLHELSTKAAAYDAALLSVRQSQALKDQHDKDADLKAQIAEAVKAALTNTRAPSLAAAIGTGSGRPVDAGRRRPF